ncbi:MAG: hypothetical protein GKR89_35385 [Candidatus Latescibacteria bacterium]|nr:hypothetical protein [Candidatus Latescibacterota bacterium]
MEWTPRVKLAHLTQLYRWVELGLYDEELLLEVGWTLYLRCETIIGAWRATSGLVPCPQCRGTVHRPSGHSLAQMIDRTLAPGPNTFACPKCQQVQTWYDCRNALRGRPRCWDCLTVLEHRDDHLSCPKCQRQWTGKQYRQSIKGRTRLPCPRCRQWIGQKEAGQYLVKQAHRPDYHLERAILAAAPQTRPAYMCPQCDGAGLQRDDTFHCGQCNYSIPWTRYGKSWSSRTEPLLCGGCGHRFKWHDWSRQQELYLLFTANPVPAATFMAAWPHARDPTQRLRHIDNLLNALHARGSLLPFFVAGDEARALAVLDQIAGVSA